MSTDNLRREPRCLGQRNRLCKLARSYLDLMSLGFEAFGDLDSVSANLTLAVLPEKPALARMVAAGAFMSYPAWLLARKTA